MLVTATPTAKRNRIFRAAIVDPDSYYTELFYESRSARLHAIVLGCFGIWRVKGPNSARFD